MDIPDSGSIFPGLPFWLQEISFQEERQHQSSQPQNYLFEFKCQNPRVDIGDDIMQIHIENIRSEHGDSWLFPVSNIIFYWTMTTNCSITLTKYFLLSLSWRRSSSNLNPNLIFKLNQVWCLNLNLNQSAVASWNRFIFQQFLKAQTNDVLLPIEAIDQKTLLCVVLEDMDRWQFV